MRGLGTTTPRRGLSHGGELGDVRTLPTGQPITPPDWPLFQMFESGFSPYPGCFSTEQTMQQHLSESRRFLGGFHYRVKWATPKA